MLPLEGLRVLDLSQVMAGPFCCMLLGDMGADVIKVEPPRTGDQSRRSMGFRMKGEDSPGFLALNRNKRSIVLDLKDPGDREILYALVKTADVLVENGRPGVAERLGIDEPTLRKINPRLIYASISGFGQSGPWALRPGFDLIAQAMSGVLSATGSEAGEQAKSGVSVGDLGAALFTLYGILCALIGRERSGAGEAIDASLFEAALALSVWEATEFWATGRSPAPMGTANRMSAPYQAVDAADGRLVIGGANDKLWLLLLGVIGREELADDRRFATNADRVANRTALMEALRPTFLLRTVDEWVSALLEAGVPAGPIFDFEKSLNSEQAAARDMVIEIEHPVEGPIRALGFPVKMKAGRQQVRYPPPLLDQHGDEIVSELVNQGLLGAGVQRRGYLA